MSIRRAVLYALLPAAGVACSDIDRPTRPNAAIPITALAIEVPTGPTGIAGFAFLPPITTGTADAADPDRSILDLLAVEICEWNGQACVQPLVQRLTAQTSAPSRLELSDDGVYQTRWVTRADALNPDRTYRIRVLASGGELGHADVDIVPQNTAVGSSQAGFVRLVAGSTLPISFVVRKGTGARVGAAGGTVTLAGGVTLEVPEGALPNDVFLTAVPAANLPPANQPMIPGTGWDFGPDGLTFAKAVVMTIPYDPSVVPGDVPQGELRIHKLVNGSYVQQDAGLVDLANHTVSADVHSFSIYVVVRRDPNNPQDVLPPVLKLMEVRNASNPVFGSATSLDVTTADATLITRINLTDNGAGVLWIDLRWLSPTGRQMRFPCYRGGDPESGSDTNGEWLCTTTFPRYAEGGLWKPAVVWIRDKVQNQALFVNYPGGLCQTSDPTNCLTDLPQITVNSAVPDIDPPVLGTLGVSLDVQPRSFGASLDVDVGVGARRVWFGFPATDNLSGLGDYLPYDYFLLSLEGPNRQVVDYFGPCNLTQGTNVNGFWECAVDVPAQAQTGTWRLARLRIPDRVGNGGFSGYSDFVPNGLGQLCNRTANCLPSPTIQVTSSGDGDAPSLQSVDIQKSLGQVTTTLGITDNISGVSFVRVRYISATTTQFQECFPPRTSGSATNGTWACTITFSSLAARGQWFLEVEVWDVAGNRRYYTRRASDGFLCYWDPISGAQVCGDYGTTDLVLL